MNTKNDLDRIIYDEGVKKYILAELRDNWDGQIKNFPIIYNNIINLAFIYAFSCYNDLNNRLDEDGNPLINELLKSGNANAVRVIRTMQKIYTEHPITNEIIQFILMDIFFDFERGSGSLLRGCFPQLFSSNSDAQLSYYFSIINKCVGHSRNVPEQLSFDDAMQKLEALIELFPFLQKSSLVYDAERQWYTFKIAKTEKFPKGIVNTFGVVNRIKKGRVEYYYLSSIEGTSLKYEKINHGGFIQCELTGFEGEHDYVDGMLRSPYRLPFDEEYILSYINHENLEKRKSAAKNSAIDQLFNINYKYIKNLALAIADSLGKSEFAECSERLKHEYIGKFPDAFEKFDAELNNWDSVVLMLLIEVGPFNVLQKLFLINYAIGNSIVENLEKRFEGEIGKDLHKQLGSGLLKKNAEKYVRLRQIRLDQMPVLTKTYESTKRNLIAETMANLILSIIANCNENESTPFYIGNIQQNIEALQNLAPSTPSEEKCHMVRIAFGDMLKRIICFYEGVFAYGGIKLEYDKKSSEKMLSEKEIRAFQNKLETAFSVAATNTYKKLSDARYETSILNVLQEFYNMKDACYKKDTINGYSFTHTSEALYSVLGKYTVVDYDEFSKYINIENIQDLNHANVDWWIEKSIGILRFFKSGSFDENENSFGAITPYIASYNKGNKSRDGYHTATFSLIIDSFNENNDLVEINVLTEFKCDMCSKYYCIPNVGRSTDKWWIDPLIVKCHIFDDVFETR